MPNVERGNCVGRFLFTMTKNVAYTPTNPYNAKNNTASSSTQVTIPTTKARTFVMQVLDGTSQSIVLTEDFVLTTFTVTSFGTNPVVGTLYIDNTLTYEHYAQLGIAFYFPINNWLLRAGTTIKLVVDHDASGNEYILLNMIGFNQPVT